MLALAVSGYGLGIFTICLPVLGRVVVVDGPPPSKAELYSSLAPFVLALAFMGFVYISERRLRRRYSTVAVKVGSASVDLVERIERETMPLAVRDANHEQLASLRQAQANAVQQLVEQTVMLQLSSAHKRAGRQQWLFFVAGLTLSLPIGVAGNFVYTLVAG